MSKHKRNKFGRLEVKSIDTIILARPLKIDGGRYVCYCNYPQHQGVIKTEEKYIDCVSKGCEDLYVFKIEQRDKSRI